jgi:hypothetical protein
VLAWYSLLARSAKATDLRRKAAAALAASWGLRPISQNPQSGRDSWKFAMHGDDGLGRALQHLRGPQRASRSKPALGSGGQTVVEKAAQVEWSHRSHFGAAHLLIHSGVVRVHLQGFSQEPFVPQLPPNRKFGEWLSLVEHLVRDQGVGGSNPLSPTI